MNCPDCGVDNREGARFCRRCGTELADAPTAEAPFVAEVAEETLDTEVPEWPEGEAAAEVEAGPHGAQAAQAPDERPEAVGEEPQGLEQSLEESVDAVAAQPAAEGDTEFSAEMPEPLADEPAPQSPEVELGAEKEVVGEEDLEIEEVLDTGSETGTEDVETDEEGAMPPLPWDEADEDEPPLPEFDESSLSFWRQDAEPLTPVVPGMVVAGRYLVVEALDVQEDEILYHVRDLQRCWQCGFEDNAPDEAFCAQCGAALDRKVDARLWEVRDEKAEPASGEGVAERLLHEGQYFVVPTSPQLEAEPEDLVAEKPAGIRLLVGRRTDPGQLRELNEDSILTFVLVPSYETSVGPVQGLFAVADGMGGHEGGEIASRLALQVLAEQVMRAVILPELAGELVREEDIVARLHQATIAANDAVYLDRKKRESDMGTTLTSAFIRDDRLFLAHVGDCRAYRWNADGLEQLTVDHSVVASMIADGQAEPEEIYTHPHRSIIYRCIGDKPVVEVDADLLPLAPGDRIVVCSDGLWEMIRDEGVADVMMQEADPQLACDMLVRHANAAGGDDNISVIVVQMAEM
jgi:serine/threonine protein phosphatase PrpC